MRVQEQAGLEISMHILNLDQTISNSRFWGNTFDMQRHVNATDICGRHTSSTVQCWSVFWARMHPATVGRQHVLQGTLAFPQIVGFEEQFVP